MVDGGVVLVMVWLPRGWCCCCYGRWWDCVGDGVVAMGMVLLFLWSMVGLCWRWCGCHGDGVVVVMVDGVVVLVMVWLPWGWCCCYATFWYPFVCGEQQQLHSHSSQRRRTSAR